MTSYVGVESDWNMWSKVKLNLAGIHGNAVKNTSAFLFSRSALSLMSIINDRAPLEHRWRGQLFGQGWVIKQEPDVCFYWVVDAGPNRLVLHPLSATKGLMAPCGQRGKLLICRENAGLTSISIKAGCGGGVGMGRQGSWLVPCKAAWHGWRLVQGATQPPQ